MEALDPEPLLRFLHERGVEHILIGGVAVAAHGYPRPSKDLDIVPSPRPENPETTPAEKTAAASDLAQTPKKSSDKQ
jgi:hypothetical protein